MSRTFTLVGKGNVLEYQYYPPIELKENQKYGLGLIGFYSFNTIPNVNETNNKLYYGDGKVLVVPKGTYEVDEIHRYIEDYLSNQADNGENHRFTLKANNNTLKCEITSDYKIDFTPDDSLGSLLGFSRNRILEPHVLHQSDLSVQIVKVVNIRIDCDLTTGAYWNNQLVHTIFEFAVTSQPGCSITCEPTHIIYLPVTAKTTIERITVCIVDQDGDPVDFQNEKVVVRLELKEI